MSERANDTNALRKAARRCEASEDFDGAIANWSRLAELAEDQEAFERLGVIAIRRSEFREALRFLKKAVDLAPMRGKTRVLFARAADEAATLDEALDAWNEAARIEPSVESHLRMGAICGELGREADAIAHLENAWNADPGKIKPLRALAKIHEMRADYDKAADVWRRALDGEARGEALANLGRLSALEGKTDEALAFFDEALAAGEEANILRKIAAIHEQNGALAKAEEMLRRALQQKDEAVTRHHLAVLLRDQGRIDDAIDEFRAAAILEPNVRRYWMETARLCERVGRFNEAADAWENIATFEPDGEAFRRLAVLQMKLNRPKEAAKTLQKYVELTGETADSWRRIAGALEDGDEPAAAAKAWRRALAIAPGDQAAERRLAQLYYNEDCYPEHRGEAGALPSARPTIGARMAAIFRRDGASETDDEAFREDARESAVVGAMRRELDEIAASDAPILIGPWLSELGFELLYWIPFLKWALRRSNISPDRLIVASRGGMRPLYETLGKSIRYLDIFDHLSPDEFRALNERRWRETGLQKHLSISDVDRSLIDKFSLGGDARILHPKMMYMLFASYWSGRAGFRRYRSHVELTRLRAIDHPVLESLPRSFVAVKFYSRPSFPNTQENSERLRRYVERLAEKSPVVILNTGLAPDEHGEFAFEPGDNVHFINHAISPSENLHAQAAVVSRAAHLHCTYGGFTYLPLYFGGAVTSYYAGDRHYMHMHAPAAYWTAEKLGARISVVEADALDA